MCCNIHNNLCALGLLTVYHGSRINCHLDRSPGLLHLGVLSNEINTHEETRLFQSRSEVSAAA